MALAPVKFNGGRPWNVLGMSRANAPSKPIDPGMIATLSGSVQTWLRQGQSIAQRELPFFPPGQPITPVAPSAAGRAFDYSSAYNVNIRPRSYEPIDFETLRAVADPSCGGWDLIRLAIETRKDQVSKLTYSVLPRKKANQQLRSKPDPRCEEVEQFLRRPDGHWPWETWIRMLLEDHLTIDAATIYKRPNLAGGLAKLEILDGASILPRLAYDGRRPDTGPAYTQVLKGLPAVDYTADELIYAPRNPRSNKVYGYSCVEQVLITINIGLRRQVSQLGYFTEGTVPDAVASVPPDWPISKIQEFQDYWDSVVNDVVRRRKLKFIPGGTTFQQTRNDTALVDAFDEWLARVVQYCFSLPPTPLVRAVNRATAESAYDQSLDEGLQPLMVWLQNIMNDIIVRWFGYPDLEFVWDDIKKVDPAEKEQRDTNLVEIGVISRDDMRADRGQEPLGIGPVVQGIGPLGFMSIDAMKKAIANGWDLTGMPQPGMGGDMGAAGGVPGGVGADLSQWGTGGDGDPLKGLPPEILQALGVDTTDGDAPVENTPTPATPKPSPIPARARPSAGAGNNVVQLHQHPAVLAALAQGDAHAKRMAARFRQ